MEHTTRGMKATRACVRQVSQLHTSRERSIAQNREPLKSSFSGLQEAKYWRDSMTRTSHWKTSMDMRRRKLFMYLSIRKVYRCVRGWLEFVNLSKARSLHCLRMARMVLSHLNAWSKSLSKKSPKCTTWSHSQPSRWKTTWSASKQSKTTQKSQLSCSTCNS